MNAGCRVPMSLNTQPPALCLLRRAHDNSADVVDRDGGFEHLHAGEGGEMHDAVTDEGDLATDLFAGLQMQFDLLAGLRLKHSGLRAVFDWCESIGLRAERHGGDENEEVQGFHGVVLVVRVEGTDHGLSMTILPPLSPSKKKPWP